MKPAQHRAFTLLEIMIAAAIVVVLGTSLLLSLRSRVFNTQLTAENKAMDALAADIARSFESTDFADRNVAAINGSIPSGQSPTTFSWFIGLPATTITTDWFAKVARMRGITPIIGVAPSSTSQPELARIVQNDRKQPRYLFIDPNTSDTHQVRFILCSIIDDGSLTFPPPAGSTSAMNVSAFEAIWNTNFETESKTLPAYWSTSLTPAQQNLWLSGEGDGSRMNRFVVRRIILPYHYVTVNNNHTSQNAYVCWKSDGSSTADLTVAAGAGTVTTLPILEGRHITVRIGTTLASSVIKYQIVLRKDVTFTVE